MSADDINWRNARRPILICSFGVREKTRMSIAVHGMCMDVLETKEYRLKLQNARERGALAEDFLLFRGKANLH